MTYYKTLSIIRSLFRLIFFTLDYLDKLNFMCKIWNPFINYIKKMGGLHDGLLDIRIPHLSSVDNFAGGNLPGLKWKNSFCNFIRSQMLPGN